MCGIVGAWHPDGKHIFKMDEALTHRGPDTNTLAIGHTLQVCFSHLKIMDKSTLNSQPFACGDWVVWMNGCIYNQAELDREVISRNKWQSYKSGSDAETVGWLINELGIYDAIPKLNGMFAIVAQNRQTNEVYIARDRYGIKPMFYAEVSGGFVFASEAKALLKHPDLKWTPNVQSIGQWLSFQNVLGNDTFFNGIQSVPPATIWCLNTQQRTKYWHWDFTPVNILYSTAVEECETLVRQAIKRQMCMDGAPITSWLSGGIDSSAIALYGDHQKMQIADFPGEEFSELKYAGIVATHLKKELCAYEYDSAAMWDNLYQTIHALDTLKAGPSWSNYALYKSTREKGFKVCLQGTGADELFGGYSWRYRAPNYFDIVYRSKVNLCRFAFDWQSFVMDNPSMNERYKWDSENFLTGLLHVGDHLSMAHGIEDRVPFLDNDLVNFACHLPYEYKENKKVLRESLRGYLPMGILSRKKKGFTSPEAVWYYQPENIDRIRRLVEGTPSMHEYLYPGILGSLFATYNTAAIWSILALSVWCRIHLMGESREDFNTFIQ